MSNDFWDVRTRGLRQLFLAASPAILDYAKTFQFNSFLRVQVRVFHSFSLMSVECRPPPLIHPSLPCIGDGESERKRERDRGTERDREKEEEKKKDEW